MSNDERARVANHLSRARAVQLPATLTVLEWTRTVADFAGLCAYCGTTPMAVLEHFIPLSRGGGTTAGNCLPACDACDAVKCGKAPEVAIAADRLAYLRSYLATRSTGQDVGTPISVTGLVALHRNLPAEIIAALDAQRDRINTGPQWPKITRTDLIRNVLTEAAVQWNAKPAKSGK